MNYVEPTGDEARQQAFDRPPLMKAPESNPYWRSLGNISMIDWERLAGWYAAVLAEANSKVRNLEDRLAELEKPAAPVEPSRSDVLANCMRADRTLDAYGR